MAVDQCHNDNLIFASLAFMDRNGICQRYFVQFRSFIFDIVFRISDIYGLIGYSKHFSYVTVEYAFFVIILLLHYFIASSIHCMSIF